LLYVTALLLVVLLLRRGFTVITVFGRSMEPTFVNGDRVLLLRFWLQRWLRRGQLVVCQDPTAASLSQRQVNEPSDGSVRPAPEKYVVVTHRRNYYIIKRLWGLGGDRVVVPAQDVPTPAAANKEDRRRDAAGNFVWQVPAGHCFVKGDHSSYSYDSTSWGPIPIEFVTGIVLVKLPRRADPAVLEREGISAPERNT
jgi:signal peptidase I